MIAVLFAEALSASTRFTEEAARFGGWAALVIAPLAMLDAAAIGWVVGPPRRTTAQRARDPLVLGAAGTLIVMFLMVLVGNAMPETLQRLLGLGLLFMLPLGVMALVAYRERMLARGLGATHADRALFQATWAGGFSATMFLFAGLTGAIVPNVMQDMGFENSLFVAMTSLGSLAGLIAVVILTHQSLRLARALVRWSHSVARPG